jgi:type VI secretion system protein ImpK
MDRESSFDVVSVDPTVIRTRSKGGRPDSGANPLVLAAVQTLVLARRIRIKAAPADLDELHLRCVREMRVFEKRIWKAQLPHDQVIAASYALCVLIDEAVMSMPWAARTSWAARSMAMTFHGESSCADKLLNYVHLTMADPARYLTLLELLYICLSIGFQGEHPIKDPAARELLNGRYELLRSIQSARGTQHAEPLPPVLSNSQHGRGQPPSRWLMAIVAFGLVTTLAVFFRVSATVKHVSAPAGAADSSRMNQNEQ